MTGLRRHALGTGSAAIGPDLVVTGDTRIPGTDVVSAVLDGQLDTAQCRITGTWNSFYLEESGTYEFHRTG
jgi:hypothetical protein